MIKKCNGCPFNDMITEEASKIQDYGCLPSQFDIKKWQKETGKNWACHSKPAQICAGLLNHCQENKLTVDFSKPLITESTEIKEIYKNT